MDIKISIHALLAFAMRTFTDKDLPHDEKIQIFETKLDQIVNSLQQLGQCDLSQRLNCLEAQCPDFAQLGDFEDGNGRSYKVKVHALMVPLSARPALQPTSRGISKC
jgi:hypothetical protein